MFLQTDARVADEQSNYCEDYRDIFIFEEKMECYGEENDSCGVPAGK